MVPFLLHPPSTFKNLPLATFWSVKDFPKAGTNFFANGKACNVIDPTAGLLTFPPPPPPTLPPTLPPPPTLCGSAIEEASPLANKKEGKGGNARASQALSCKPIKGKRAERAATDRCKGGLLRGTYHILLAEHTSHEEICNAAKIRPRADISRPGGSNPRYLRHGRRCFRHLCMVV